VEKKNYFILIIFPFVFRDQPVKFHSGGIIGGEKKSTHPPVDERNNKCEDSEK
jgi:hypothetical protein